MKNKQKTGTYDGRCALCKFWRPAFDDHRSRDDESVVWDNDVGWCVRYPPAFIGGKEIFSDEADTNRFSQPGVWGHDECGEWRKR